MLNPTQDTPASTATPRVKSLLSYEALFDDCGIEAAGDHMLGHTDIKQIYRNVWLIDTFIRKLKANHDVSDLVKTVNRNGRQIIEWSAFGKEFVDLIAKAYSIQADLSSLTPFLTPHPSVKALMDSADAVGPQFTNYYAPGLRASDPEARRQVASFLEKLTKSANLLELKKASDNLRRSCNKNFKGLSTYLLSLIRKLKRVLIVRLDLLYHHDFAMDYKASTHARISADRVKFLNMIRRDYPAFAGYAWKLEFGIQRRWHLHTLLCFDGDEVCNDIIIGRTLGEEWVKLTGGKGDYYNCNGKRGSYRFDAIGMVRESDQTKIDWLMEYAATYLTKLDYFVGLQLPADCRAFGKGQIPRSWIAKSAD